MINKAISLINDNKDELINQWFNSKKLQEIVNTYNLDTRIIKQTYAPSLWDYYICLLLEKDEDSSSKFFSDFIKYLKVNDLKAYEFFILMTEFKHIIMEYLIENGINKPDTLGIVDRRFEKLVSQVLDVFSKSTREIEKTINKSVDIVDKYILMSRTDKNGYITSVSTAFCMNSGFSEDELIGKCYETLKYDKDEKILENIYDIVKANIVWKKKLKYRKKNGDYYWVKTTIHPNFDNIGEFIGFDAIYENITAQVEFEKQQSILIEQSKSAAMGEMISMIAHQWRQPLQAVSILVQKLSLLKMLEQELSDELVEEVVEQVLGQLDYMSKTIDDFRDYFKPDKKKESVYIKDLVERSIDFLEYLFKVNVVKVSYINRSESLIDIYLNEIVQVFINLSKNSIDAMIENNIRDRFINICSYEDEQYLYIEFEDNAGGIDEIIINKIFDPYFSTKQNKNGTGLGLYMSKQIIQEHSDGELYVENIPNGSRFTVKLPINRR